MSAGWSTKLPSWQPHDCSSGVTYSLAHLSPIRFEIVLAAHKDDPERTVEVRVAFSHHTFTEKSPTPTAIDEYLGRRSEPRFFCTARYEHSKKLPNIVRGLQGRKCYFAKQQNYFVFEAEQVGFEYRIFFDVRKVKEADGAILVYVQSAYIADTKTAPNGKRQKVGFNVLVKLALVGERPNPPP
jgi:hypothetical protein